MKQNLIVFGIDVGSRKSNVCIMANQIIVKEYKISNDAIGFSQLLQDLQLFAQAPDIVFEATGIYSDRLQAFLVNHGYRYCKLNPLQAHQQLMRFRMSKTDKHDARDLANSQFIFHRRPSYQQNTIYSQLKAWSHYYDQLTHDLVTAKNRLHRLLQEVFPELETLMTHTKNYYYCVQLFTHPEIVKQLGFQKIFAQLMTLSGVGHKTANRHAHDLLDLAQQSYPAVPADYPQVEQTRDYAQRIIVLSIKRKQIIKKMSKLAAQLPKRDDLILESIPGLSDTTSLCLLGELGDIRRFRNANALNAFVGVDLRHYESGKFTASDHISKRGNPIARKLLYRAIGQIDNAAKTKPCHIADYYELKKQSSQTKGFKKIAIAAVHKLIRTVYHLIVCDQKYQYSLVKR